MKRIFYSFRNIIFPYIAFIIIKFLSQTLKISVINSEIVEKLKKEGKKIIYAFWHGQHFALIYFNRNKDIAILTSLSRDGEMLTKILQKFGYFCIRGSSSKGGSRALKEMIMALRQGRDLAFAVDGPKGPLHEAKPGAVFLAQITRSAILPVSCYASPAFIFKKAWDKYILPYPFARVFIVYGEPIIVKRDDNLEEKNREISKILNDLSLKARKMSGKNSKMIE